MAFINSKSKRPDHDDEKGRHQAFQPASRIGRLRRRYTITHVALTERTATSTVQEIGDHDVRLCLSSGTSYTEDGTRYDHQQDLEAFFEHSACFIFMSRRSTASAMPSGGKINLVSTTSLSTNRALFPAETRHIHFVSIFDSSRRLPKCLRCLDHETKLREIATPRAET